MFGLPTHGGSIAALCRWRSDAGILRLAGGDPIYVASRVRNGSGELVADGPRSQPVPAGEESCRLIVPLSIPRTPGSYEIELDPLVEGKAWGSSLGLAPALVRLERLRNGELVWRHGRISRRLRRPNGRPGVSFRIPHRLYGAAETERCVEVPWVLSRYRGEQRVLDVGYAHAERLYITALGALRIPLLVGIDLVASTRPDIRGVVADVRSPSFRLGSFDLVLAVSVIEHVGRDNRRYVGDAPDPADVSGDFAAIRALAALLAPGGRLLLTLPFGAAEDHGWFIQYDARRLDRLVAASGLGLAEAEFYRYDRAWRGPVPARSLAGSRYGDNAIAASGVACLTLRRARIAAAPGLDGRLIRRSRRVALTGRPANR